MSDPTRTAATPRQRAPVYQLVVPSLAALVLRQARNTLIEGRMVAGIDRRIGSPIGLQVEDRNAMALISRVCLEQGMPDHGSEIHDLLHLCASPLGDWLKLPELLDAGLSDIRLINLEDGLPTPEAEELAKGFSTLTAGLEEQLFEKFVGLLAKLPKGPADEYYTRVREFVVRHPLASDQDFAQLAEDIPATIRACIEQQFYEPVPDSWGLHGVVTTCIHCGNALRHKATGDTCRTAACMVSHPTTIGEKRPLADLYRLTRGVRQYWLEPGVDEIQTFDALQRAGITATLYPHRDRVDIEVGDIGIDLKAYASPELLGAKLNRNKGGLAHYRYQWLVVPDWLASQVPSYLDRLRYSLEEAASLIRCLTVSQAIQELTRA
jgi:hypothetical protein